MCPLICPTGKPKTDEKPEVSIEWTVEFTDGIFAIPRTIKTREDADKAVNDYLPAILPSIVVSVMENGEAKYKYVLEPKEYAVQMVRHMKHPMLRKVKDCIACLQQYVEEEEEQ